MVIENKPFYRTKLDEEKRRDTFTVAVNEEERALLNECKNIIEQPKDSTALKTLAWLGAKTLQEEKTSFIIGTVFKNKRKNKRIGIIDFE